jgi:hypothetical protein
MCNASIATITLLSVDQTLTYGPYYNAKRRFEVATPSYRQSSKKRRRGPIDSRSKMVKTGKMTAEDRVEP